MVGEGEKEGASNGFAWVYIVFVLLRIITKVRTTPGPASTPTTLPIESDAVQEFGGHAGMPVSRAFLLSRGAVPVQCPGGGLAGSRSHLLGKAHSTRGHGGVHPSTQARKGIDPSLDPHPERRDKTRQTETGTETRLGLELGLGGKAVLETVEQLEVAVGRFCRAQSLRLTAQPPRPGPGPSIAGQERTKTRRKRRGTGRGMARYLYKPARNRVTER